MIVAVECVCCDVCSLDLVGCRFEDVFCWCAGGEREDVAKLHLENNEQVDESFLVFLFSSLEQLCCLFRN